MTLGQLIRFLKTQPADRICTNGFGEPHSWRGAYGEVAFSPKAGVTVREMLESCYAALTEEFEGWKGGTFTYTKDTPVHYAHPGTTTATWNPDGEFPLYVILSIADCED